MTGLPVCEKRAASSTHFTNQESYLVFRDVYLLYNVYFIFRTGFCMTEMVTEKLSVHSIFINQHKQRACGSCAGTGFQALLLYDVSLTCPQRADDGSGHRMLSTHWQLRQKLQCLWAGQKRDGFAPGSAGYSI